MEHRPRRSDDRKQAAPENVSRASRISRRDVIDCGIWGRAGALESCISVREGCVEEETSEAAQAHVQHLERGLFVKAGQKCTLSCTPTEDGLSTISCYNLSQRCEI